MLQPYITNLMTITQTSHLHCPAKVLASVLHQLKLVAKLRVILEAPYDRFCCLSSSPFLLMPTLTPAFSGCFPQ